jgi:hypothetical protein
VARSILYSGNLPGNKQPTCFDREFQVISLPEIPDEQETKMRKEMFEELEKKIEAVYLSAERYKLLSEEFQKDVSEIRQILNLRTLSVREAHLETGIGVTKIMAAIKTGAIPYIKDGKAFRIHHPDLLSFINSIKTK